MIGGRIIDIPKVKSTNDYVVELMNFNAEIIDGDVYLTHEQVAGKGQGENSWESEPGKNLTFSIYLEPIFLNPADQFFLNMSISLGIQTYLANLIDETVMIKWPNDIYISDKKVAGILINHSIGGNHLMSSVIGIGLNVNQMEFMSDAPNPASLMNFTRQEYNLDKLLHGLIGKINEYYLKLKNRDYENLTSMYYNVMIGYNQWRNYLYQKKRITAKVTGISSFGTLLLIDEQENNLECGFKEIEFII